MGSRTAVVMLAAIVVSLSLGATPFERRAVHHPAGNQYSPVTATDGRDFIAVWIDQRVESQVHMNIVRADGEVAFPLAVVLSGTQRRCTNPAVTWNGRTYLVGWADYVYGTGWEISLVRVSADGRVLDGTPRRVLSTGLSTPWSFGPAFATNGGTTILSTPAYDPSGIRLLALDADANVVASSNFDRYGASAAHDVVALGANFVIVTLGYNDVEASVLSLDGIGMKVGPTRSVNVLNDPYSHTELLGVVSNGNTAVAFLTITGLGTYSVYARPITATAIGERVTVVPPTDLTRSNSGGWYIPIPSFSAIPHGDGFLVAMKSILREIFDPNLDGPPGRDDYPLPNTLATYQTLVARTDAAGRPLEWSNFGDEGRWEGRVSIAHNGHDLFAVWNETLLHYPVMDKITAGLGDPSRLQRIDLAFNRPQQSSPRIAAGGEGALVVWREEPANDGIGVIMARPYGSDGVAAGPAVRVSAGTRNQIAPRVAFDGSQFLVAWIDNSPPHVILPIAHRVVARRVARDGTLLDPEPHVVTGSFYGRSFGLASNGEDFAIAYDADYPFLQSVIMIVRIRDSFDSMNVSAVHTGEVKIDSEVEIAARGRDYVVGWSSGTRFTASVATASVGGDDAARVESFWSAAPVLACTQASCLALAYRSIATPTLLAIPIAPASSSPPAPVPQAWIASDGLRITGSQGEYLAAARVREGIGWSLRAQVLAPDGSALSEEVRAIEPSLVGDFDVTMTGDGFFVAYIRQDGSGAPRVVVRRIPR